MTSELLTDSITVAPRTGITSAGVETFGTAVPMMGRFQDRTFTIQGVDGKAIQIEGIVYTDHTTALALGSKLVFGSDSFRIVSRRVYRGLDGPSHQSCLVERIYQ